MDTGLETQLSPYNGPRSRVAVTDFDWNVGTNQTTIGIGGTRVQEALSTYRHQAATPKNLHPWYRDAQSGTRSLHQ